jgi:hypothetical protein
MAQVPAEEHVVVPGSLQPFVATAVAAVMLLLIGGLAARDGGITRWVLVVLALGALALAVLLLDLPLRTEVGPFGLVRVCILRRERIGWERVVAIERQRRRVTGPGTGGLVVRGRGARWFLTASAEPPAVHARLAALVAACAPAVRMRAEPPAVEAERR